MIPVLTPEEMRAVDEAAAEPVAVLIARAGSAVARAALDMLGGGYGRRVVVIAGPGNNGADGRVAATRLRERGVVVTVIDVGRDTPPPPAVGPCDLVIDAAYGTGFRGAYIAPDCGGARVLAVDIPTGVDGGTGEVPDGTIPVRADTTVTFAAYKPGLLFGRGPELAGRIILADIGLGAAAVSTIGIVERDDVRNRLPRRARDTHKWRSAVLVVGGSPGMLGAPSLAAAAAQRAGAGMVRLAVPGGSSAVADRAEAVGVELPLEAWATDALAHAERCRAVVIGPGLGRSGPTRRDVRAMLAKLAIPAVVDADALAAIGTDDGAPGEPAPVTVRPRVPPDPAVRAAIRAAFAGGPPRSGASFRAGPDPTIGLSPGQRAVLQATARRIGAAPRAAAQLGTPAASDLEAAVRSLGGRLPGTTVLTPHDGEFAVITGHRPTSDRVGDARRLAETTGAVVLLKGPTTVVAAPDGWVELVIEGDARLATAGTGDVLAGMIGAFLAQGLDPLTAASTAAWVHGHAARRGQAVGMTAGDLPALVSIVCSEFASTDAGGATVTAPQP